MRHDEEMSSSELKRLYENAVEAGRLIDIADRRLYDILLKMTKAENAKYGEGLNAALNCLERAKVLLPKPMEEKE